MNQPALLRYASLPQAIANLAGKVVGSHVLIGKARFVVVPSLADARNRAIMPLLDHEDWPCPVALAQSFT